MTKRKICLDAGHYGKTNRSPAVPAYYESEMNWKLHLKLKAALERYGFEVITTRTDQAKDLGLTSRGAASKGCDLFFSIHSNAVGSTTNEAVDYPLVIVQLDGKGNTLGRALGDAIRQTMGTKQAANVWTKKGNSGEYYGVLRGAASVGTMGMILEHSFHTQTRAAQWLSVDSNLDKLAEDEARVIAAHFGVEKPVAEEKNTKPYGECTVKLPVLKKGMKVQQVRTMQMLLIGYGYSCGSSGVDGSFGGATDKALRAYQKDKGLAVDGSCGPATWKSLLGVNDA